MKIEDKLVASVISGLKALYSQEVPEKMVQIQKTKKEFEGHLTLVVFPFLKMSRKGPEQTAQEYLQAYQAKDFSRGLLMGGKSMVYRDNDIFSADELEKTECFQRFSKAEGFQHSVHVLPAFEGKVLAKISFYRAADAPDFVYDDVFLLDMVKEHLALRIARCYEEHVRQHEKLSIHECEEQFRLTARETTILGLLMQGLPNDVICGQLTITNNTLKKHILNIYKKLSIRNRTQLFKMVREYPD